MFGEGAGIDDGEVDFFFEGGDGGGKVFEAEVVVVLFIDQEVDLGPPVDVALSDLFIGENGDEFVKGEVFDVEGAVEQVEQVPGFAVSADDFVEVDAGQAGVGAAENGEGVAGGDEAGQVGLKGGVVGMNPVKVLGGFDAAVGQGQGKAQGGAGVFGDEGIDCVGRIETQGMACGELMGWVLG